MYSKSIIAFSAAFLLGQAAAHPMKLTDHDVERNMIAARALALDFLTKVVARDDQAQQDAQAQNTVQVSQDAQDTQAQQTSQDINGKQDKNANPWYPFYPQLEGVPLDRTGSCRDDEPYCYGGIFNLYGPYGFGETKTDNGGITWNYGANQIACTPGQGYSYQTADGVIDLQRGQFADSGKKVWQNNPYRGIKDCPTSFNWKRSAVAAA